MLIYLYVFALVLGGVLLAASILLGGHGDGSADLHAEIGTDLHAEAGGDLHAEAGAEAQASEAGGGGHEAGAKLPVVAAHPGDVSGFDLFWAFRSVRFWTFFLAFFGLTGLVLQGLGLVGRVGSALLAVGMGGGAGFVAAGALRWLGRDESGAIASSAEYIGKTARVLLPVRKGGMGKVRLTLHGASVDVLATTDEDEPFEVQDEALIIEMDGPEARIARLNQ